MLKTKEGMPSGVLGFSFNITLKCLGHPQAWGLATHYSPHIDISPKT